MENRPQGRQKNITGAGKGVYKRGSGLGTGPVGSTNRPTASNVPPQRPARQTQRAASYGQSASGGSIRLGKLGPLLLIVIAAIFIFSRFGGGQTSPGQTMYSGSPSGSYSQADPYSGWNTQGSSSHSSGYSGGSGYDLGSLLGGFTSSSASSPWENDNTGSLDETVAAGSRAKYTSIRGGGRDTVTILVYMCGTDLESQSGMGSSDLKEMASASLGDQVNVLVYTGGCRSWKISGISSSVNQIYRVEDNGLRCLVSDAGNAVMTRPETLASFIRWGADNYPADRMELILWDHGGGSISGYGYDEKASSAGSMSLDGIASALKAGGVTFDFIGFDACLMATLENGLTLTPYADYLIASEETEPGVGWYYTNWLSSLGRNTSLPTAELGKLIADDFVSVCAKQCPGQKTTLSVVDLAELEHTVPEALRSFAAATTEKIRGDGFREVSKARSTAREFASSSKIDQVDLVDLALNLGTDEAKDFADALLGAVKYNRTSSNMTNAYGLSIFFPYQRASKVSTAVKTYDAIGMEDAYSECIEAFAGMEMSGQAVSGGASSPLNSLLGSGYSSGASTDVIGEILQGLMAGNMYGISGMSGGNADFFGRAIDPDSAEKTLAADRFDASALVWTKKDGVPQLSLREEQWGLVSELELNVFVDDGEGYIDLGLDNVFEFTETGALLGEYDGTWLAINNQVVAYYHTDTLTDGDNYVITGYVPVLLNGVRSQLIIVFDNDHPYGYIAGACTDYRNGETETIAKSLTELTVGDELDFVCDYYTYDGEYQDSYLLGERMTVTEDMVISNVYINAPASATYRFTDIYCQQYWTSPIPQE